MRRFNALALLRRQTSSGSWIPELDGLRFIAIVSVVFFHIAGQIEHHHTAQISNHYAWMSRALLNGYRGVQLFFMISGFILARPFAEHHLFGKPAPSLGRYFLRRVTRLEPPYILNLLVMATASVLVLHETWGYILPHLLASIAYIHYPVFHSYSVINSVAWSLEIEVQFYILAPFIASIFMIRSAPVRRLTLTGLIVAAGTLQIAADISKGTLAGEIQYFLGGLLLADLFLTASARKSDWRWDLVSLIGWPLVFLIGPSGMQLWLPFLVMLLYVAAYQGVVMRSFVRTQWIAITGGMCYTIYLWHAPIMTFLERITAKVPMLNSSDYGLLFLTRCLIQIPVIAVVSVLLFLLVERPCMDPRWPQKLRDYFARLFGNSAAYEGAPEA